MDRLKGLFRHGGFRPLRAEPVGENGIPVHQHRRAHGQRQRRGQHHRHQQGLPEKAPGPKDGGVEVRFGLC